MYSEAYSFSDAAGPVEGGLGVAGNTRWGWVRNGVRGISLRLLMRPGEGGWTGCRLLNEGNRVLNTW